MIAAEAGVNWSLVGYYFRGKDRLLAEVYRRHCTALNRDRLRLLTEARRTGLQLESVIEAFVQPALAEIQGGGVHNQYSRLRGMLAAEDAPLFAQLVADNFDQSSRTFVAALRKCLPGLPADEVLWRFHFMLGTIYYSASSPQRIKAFSRGRCDPGDVDATVRHLVPFLAAGFRSAPLPRSALVRRSAADIRGATGGLARRSAPDVTGATAGLARRSAPDVTAATAGPARRSAPDVTGATAGLARRSAPDVTGATAGLARRSAPDVRGAKAGTRRRAAPR
jgi:AcrR family transcriptional regulator